ncbi:flagellar biosynthesis protein FlhF [Domibacillus sp. DTU_2020_1001157_1_SI_ALB_TIR_016]|uniref:flagellar biosynthesis protein FlhF n=1 Tax=Domibacillus sp. DTU_2020_1001157_1_SI_ALB_TIR_016 TaxID=3077789 RepID=UPI0028E290BB|nr:flagellar biosynthesis protein FlhF [Domibacillus sp. DTU_2020_1001157_1_SI_ALB_TIR_016]WNS79711.1 flagellar biosynthesis protein FlhF [Domibacillus sp. DTU_2020_1001157_1_SI_ALB_TIR_016]
MRVKKYLAPSMPEVMKKVRAELGAQAVILQSRTVYSGGIFGLFKKKNIEVVAAIDSAPAAVPAQPEVKRPALQEKPASIVPEELKNEMNDMKKMIRDLQKSTASSALYPDMLQPAIDQLSRHGIAKEWIDQTASCLFEKWHTEKEAATARQIREWTLLYLKSCLPDSGSLNKAGVKFSYLLGPTGVGKTTTIAKLASKQVLDFNRKVAFITTDTYRIAAIEQLKTYSGLLNAPMKVAYSREDMNQCMQELSSADAVFIDTAGRNYLDGQYVADLRSLIMQRPEESAYFLVLSATAKEEDLHAIIQNFSSLRIDGFIFTKVDETKTKGALLNLMYTYKRHTAFVSNGQNVPDDLIKLSTEQLVDYIFEDWKA